MDSILLFGDSLTQGGWQEGGFAGKLAYLYARRLDVINRGLSGYNSEWALPAFEKILPKRDSNGPRIRLLTIWLGANDACLEQSPQCVTIERFVQNMKTIISMVQSPSSAWHSPSTKIILITPPPISESVRAADLASRDPPLACDRTAEHSKEYVDAVLALGNELGLPTINMYQPIWDRADNGDPAKLATFLSDGLHLTATGYGILFDELMHTIQTSYPELLPDAIPMQFPPWAELNWKDARESMV